MSAIADQLQSQRCGKRMSPSPRKGNGPLSADKKGLKVDRREKLPRRPIGQPASRSRCRYFGKVNERGFDLWVENARSYPRLKTY